MQVTLSRITYKGGSVHEGEERQRGLERRAPAAWSAAHAMRRHVKHQAAAKNVRRCGKKRVACYNMHCSVGPTNLLHGLNPRRVGPSGVELLHT